MNYIIELDCRTPPHIQIIHVKKNSKWIWSLAYLSGEMLYQFFRERLGAIPWSVVIRMMNEHSCPASSLENCLCSLFSLPLPTSSQSHPGYLDTGFFLTCMVFPLFFYLEISPFQITKSGVGKTFQLRSYIFTVFSVMTCVSLLYLFSGFLCF